MLVALSSHEDLVSTRYVPRLAKPHLLAAAALGIAITSATSTQNLKEPQFQDRQSNPAQPAQSLTMRAAGFVMPLVALRVSTSSRLCAAIQPQS